LIINTLHALEVFMTPIITFEKTLDWQKILQCQEIFRF
jgi:hypothetical protein